MARPTGTGKGSSSGAALWEGWERPCPMEGDRQQCPLCMASVPV